MQNQSLFSLLKKKSISPPDVNVIKTVTKTSQTIHTSIIIDSSTNDKNVDKPSLHNLLKKKQNTNFNAINSSNDEKPLDELLLERNIGRSNITIKKEIINYSNVVTENINDKTIIENESKTTKTNETHFNINNEKLSKDGNLILKDLLKRTIKNDIKYDIKNDINNDTRNDINNDINNVKNFINIVDIVKPALNIAFDSVTVDETETTNEGLESLLKTRKETKNIISVSKLNKNKNKFIDLASKPEFNESVYIKDNTDDDFYNNDNDNINNSPNSEFKIYHCENIEEVNKKSVKLISNKELWDDETEAVYVEVEEEQNQDQDQENDLVNDDEDDIKIKSPISISSIKSPNSNNNLNNFVFDKTAYNNDKNDDLDVYKFSKTRGHNMKLDTNEMQMFLSAQRAKTSFDPKQAYDNYKASLLAEEKTKSIKNLTKKEQIIQKNYLNNQKALEKKDDEIINEIMKQNKSKPFKTLNEIGKQIKTITFKSSIIKIIKQLFISTTDIELKKQLFIEISYNEPIDTTDDDKLKVTMKEFRKKFTKNDEIDFCFQHRSDLMEPFSPLFKMNHTLEAFQVEAIEAIEKNISVVISAPTSSGKSLGAQYCIQTKKFGIAIFPTQELVDQQAGTIRAKVVNGESTPIIHLCGEKVYTDTNPVVLIGTPADVWRYIVLEKSSKIREEFNTDDFDNFGISQYDKSKTFDINKVEYVIVDELQQINNDLESNDIAQGIAMQKILMYLPNSLYVVLSATVKNIDHIVDWLKYIKKGSKNPEVKKIIYTKRFINQEKQVFTNNKLTVVSPLSVLTVDMIIADKLLASEMQFPTHQLIELSKNVELYSNDDSVNLYKYFANKKITLDTCKEYEDYLKHIMTNLAKTNPIAMQEILSIYTLPKLNIEKMDIPELYLTLKHMKDNNMLNAMVFVFDMNLCRNTCYNLLDYMIVEESKNYPLWYILRELNANHYETMLRESKNTKISTSQSKNNNSKTSSAKDLVADRTELNSQKWLNTFKREAEACIDRNIKLWEEQINENIDVEINLNRINIYTREKAIINKMDNLSYVNKYAPHPDYTFAKTLASIDVMKSIKAMLQPPKHKNDYANYEFQKPIGYNDKYMLCAERGFSFYTKNLKELDERFQGVAQLMLEEFGVQLLFSDASYAYGVNLPIRSVLFYNPEYDGTLLRLSTILAHQAQGRGARRGFDTRGYVIYMGIDYEHLLLGEYLEISGINPIDKYTGMPIMFNSKYNPSKLCKIPLGQYNNELNDNQIIEYENNVKNIMIDNIDELYNYVDENLPMYLYRLYEVTDQAHILQSLVMFITLQGHHGYNITMREFIELMICIVYYNHDDGKIFNNNTKSMLENFTNSTNELIIVGKYETLFKTIDQKNLNCCIDEITDIKSINKMKIDIINKMKELSEIIRILYSNNQYLVATWIKLSRLSRIDINNLIFKHTI